MWRLQATHAITRLVQVLIQGGGEAARMKTKSGSAVGKWRPGGWRCTHAWRAYVLEEQLM